MRTAADILESGGKPSAKTAWVNFANLQDGYTLDCTFQEASYLTHKYKQCVQPDMVEREVQYDESILDDLPSIDDLLIVSSYESIAKEFFATGDDEPADVEAEEEEAPPVVVAPRTGRPPVKVEVVEPVEEEEEEEEEEAEEGEEEEEAKPAKGQAVKITPKLKAATKLREVLTILIEEQGIKSKKQLLKTCIAIKSKVPCLERISELETRVPKAAELIDPNIKD